MPNPANPYAANTYSANAYAPYSNATTVAHTADATIVATTTPDSAADGNAANAKATVATVVGGGRVAVAHVPITRGCITSSGIAITPKGEKKKILAALGDTSREELEFVNRETFLPG